MTNPGTRRVVITGMGVVSAAACEAPGFWTCLVSGRSATHRIRRFDASAYPSQIGAEVNDDELRRRPAVADGWAGRSRIARYAGCAVEQAVADAALVEHLNAGHRVGVCVAAGMSAYEHDELIGSAAAAGFDASGNFDADRYAASLRTLLRAQAAERRNPGSIPGAVANRFGFRGPVMAVMTACSGGTQAIGDAFRWIRHGAADAAVAAGADSELSPMGLASFCLLGALSRRNDDPARASRPFEASRDGFVLGEGAGALVLEERERALRRGATIYAEVAGFGSACDAYRATDPHPDGTGAMLAMQRAIADAGLTASDIGYINAHGTGTVANDRTETRAIRRLFGDQASRIAVSSTKSMIGHATVAAGAIEAIATVLVLQHQIAHPTINLFEPDPECDLDYVPNQARPIDCEAALSNSFAFGGQTACLVLARHRL